jgi:hypothetical protein
MFAATTLPSRALSFECAIERHVYDEPIIAQRPATRVLDFLYCDKSPRDTLTVIMLPFDHTISLVPLFSSSFFFLQEIDHG